MKQTETKNEITYRPIPFLLGAFSVTWLCALLMANMDHNATRLSSLFWIF